MEQQRMAFFTCLLTLALNSQLPAAEGAEFVCEWPSEELVFA